MVNYDEWKLSNVETSDTYCERCETDYCNSEAGIEVQEFVWKDADGDRVTDFICEHCIEKIVYEGDV